MRVLSTSYQSSDTVPGTWMSAYLVELRRTKNEDSVADDELGNVPARTSYALSGTLSTSEYGGSYNL